MDHQRLLESAQHIPQPDTRSAEEYGHLCDMLAIKMNQIMSARDDLERLIGPGNQAMMEDNHRNHARFMGSLFYSYSPEVLVETVLWVYRAYRSHGFQLTYWPAQLDTWIELLRTHLSAESFNALYPFYDWMIVNQATFTELSDKQLDSSARSSDQEPKHQRNEQTK